MEYDLDISARQLMHWVRDELRRSHPRISVSATREYLSDPVPDVELENAGAEPGIGLSDMTTVGLLEVTPIHAEHRWLLRLRVEDEVGPHAPVDESVADGPELIDLDGFEEDFVAPRRGNVFISLEAETETAQEDFDLLFGEMLRDKHRA